MTAGADRSIRDEVRAALQDAGDPEAAVAMQAYMKSAMPYFGVRMPVTRRLAKAVFDRHPLSDGAVWEATVRLMYDGATHREERYAALHLLTQRRYRGWAGPETLALYEHLILVGAWWDLVDEVSHRVGELLSAHRSAVDPVLRRWSTADDLWLRRCSIICQVGHKAGTDLGLLADVIEPNLDDREFFIRKAIGWALRDVGYVEPDWVRAFVARHADRLSPLSRREALKRIGAAAG